MRARLQVAALPTAAALRLGVGQRGEAQEVQDCRGELECTVDAGHDGAVRVVEGDQHEGVRNRLWRWRERQRVSC